MQTLETERLYLRKFIPNDFVGLYRFLRKPENTIYTYFWPNSEEETKAFINSSIQKAEEIPCVDFQFAAVTKKNGVLIGSCNFLLSGEGGSHIGWIVDSDYWNQGYGTEMGRALLRFGFEELNLDCIKACCDAENIGSFRVMEKIGMRREGFLLNCRRAHKKSEKHKSDEVTYTLSKNEWKHKLLTI